MMSLGMDVEKEEEEKVDAAAGDAMQQQRLSGRIPQPELPSASSY